MNSNQTRLWERCAQGAIFNTHCHHLPEDQQGDSLEWLFEHSYVSWCGVDPAAGRTEWIRRLSGNSYYYYLHRALSELTGIAAPLSEQNWDEYAARVREICAQPGTDIAILRKNCGYRRIALDCYWNPGDDDGLPELFAPAYRINMYLFGYSTSAHDHNGNNPFEVNGWKKIDSIEEYIEQMRAEIERRAKAGCIALKCAAAYDRGLDFEASSLDAARRAFLNPEATPAEIKAFQDYIFAELCRIAAQFGLVMQLHTGLGRLDKTNALQLNGTIERNPDVCFSLMHGSYPWTNDVLALTHNYTNVVADLCWLPILSPAVSERFLEEWIDIGDMDRITWGCDTWQSFESYGAVLAMRDVVSRVFARLIERGRLSMDDAGDYIDHILWSNAARIYPSQDAPARPKL